jgi:hypothetical protein
MFNMPTCLRSSLYTGLTQIGNYSRYAVQYGAVLLAVTVADEDWDEDDDSIHLYGIEKPTEPEEWLVPTNTPLHFTVRGNPHALFMPYYQVQEQRFEVFPIVDPGAPSSS